MIEGEPLGGIALSVKARVLRLPKPPPDFTPDNWRPSWQVLDPSTTDKEHAIAHGKPVRVSVWDHGRTTVEQARAFRNGPAIVLGLQVQDVIDVAESTNRPMRVVYDPLDPPASTLPGANGHAGIEGLERADGEPKNDRRARLAELADRMELVAGRG